MIRSLRSADPTLDLRLIVGADGPLLEEASAAGAVCEVLELPAGVRSFGAFGTARTSSRGLAARTAFARRVACAGAASIRYLVRLRRILGHLRPDIVHSNGIKFHVLSGMGCVSPFPTIWHIHDLLSQRPMIGRILRTIRNSRVSAIAISRAVTEDCLDMLPGMDVATVYNAIDTERFSPHGGPLADLDALAARSSNQPLACRVGLVATYARWKGQDVFLQAAARTLTMHPGIGIHFYIVGGPIYETEGSQFSAEELRDLSQRLGLKDRVSFISFQSDTAPIYRALDVVVHASTRPEPFGLTIVESMACGRATVISDAGGAAELFCKGDDAMAIRPGNVDDLSDAIVTLAMNPQVRERLGRNARMAAVRHFHLERLGVETLAVYQALLQNRSRTP